MADDFTQYHPIWALETGDVLIARRNLHMEGSGEQIFTEGKRYPVNSMHPLADPPFVKVRDDSGNENMIQPDFLKNFKCVFASR